MFLCLSLWFWVFPDTSASSGNKPGMPLHGREHGSCNRPQLCNYSSSTSININNNNRKESNIQSPIETKIIFFHAHLLYLQSWCLIKTLNLHFNHYFNIAAQFEQRACCRNRCGSETFVVRMDDWIIDRWIYDAQMMNGWILVCFSYFIASFSSPGTVFRL